MELRIVGQGIQVVSNQGIKRPDEIDNLMWAKIQIPGDVMQIR